MKVVVKISEEDEKYFENYDDAMEYIENYIPEIENGTLSPDDIEISYHG